MSILLKRAYETAKQDDSFKKNYIAKFENAHNAVDEFLYIFVYGAKGTKHTDALIIFFLLILNLSLLKVSF